MQAATGSDRSEHYSGVASDQRWKDTGRLHDEDRAQRAGDFEVWWNAKASRRGRPGQERELAEVAWTEAWKIGFRRGVQRGVTRNRARQRRRRIARHRAATQESRS